ncbi:zinc-dependent metalloprotease [Arthrobacter cryoconiti]|uniref:Zinc-dependent metalloprotease n=1 Tax=Arthrobacter cryoconiti TaxID=748907 RepID=A0ABV8QX54_9MICC|nr:zinc-dependent metalloprotease [Arthrobacter cryoconiti]MCC9067410.1 zinc-dependent metalloprotease [Arthrobacter cryoconiti]
MGNMSPQSSAPTSPSATAGMVNWELAAATAAKLSPAGPVMTGVEIAKAVENLHLMAEKSVQHVHQISKLDAAHDLRDSEVLVVDRASWAKANTQSFAVMMDPIMGALAAKAATTQKGTGPAAVGSTITGAQLGAALAFLSSKVLGQYDPFSALGQHGGNSAASGVAPTAPGGRLLLVAPNIITVERELKVDTSDFRLWVCLHEQTHRVQFAAAPWLRHYMLGEIEKLGGLLVGDSDNLGERIRQAAKSLGGQIGKGDHKGSGEPDQQGENVPSRGGVLDLLSDPAQMAALSQVTAVMSLLEGHANVVMDGVDQQIVPSVRTIRQRFNSRGKDRGVIEKFIRNLMGLDAKMRQYSDGAKFVREVVALVGMDGFNTVWRQEGNLPTEAEIHSARLWVDRMGL